MSLSESFPGPRERAVSVGVEMLGDAELLAIVLGTGCRGVPVTILAEMLLDEHGGLAGIARAGLGEMTERAGVGMAKGARIAAAVDSGGEPRSPHRSMPRCASRTRPPSRPGRARASPRSTTKSCGYWLSTDITE